LKYHISDIANIIQTQSLHLCYDSVIENVLTDSRRLVFPATTLFFAINGPRRKGTDFIKELYTHQVRNFVVDVNVEQNIINEYKDANFILVKDVLLALQQLAIHHRNIHQATVIGITGSNGKTIVKEWLYQLLHRAYDIVRSPKSYNSQIGVPLSVLQMSSQNNLAIFEAGISMPNEMEKLQPIINPEIGILTFMGEAHAEGFDSLQQKINEKIKLFSNSKILIYCAENNLVDELVTKFAATENKEIKLFSWSRTGNADLLITSVNQKFSMR
jgi:alanine racemase